MLKELTPEMQAAIPAHVAKWIANGRRTDEVKWEEFNQVVLDMYRLAGLPAPKEILRARNPALAASVGHDKAFALDGTGGRQLMTTAGSGGGCARFEFLIDVCGVSIGDAAPKWDVQKRFHQVGFGIYFHGEFAIMVDRPSLLKMTQVGEAWVLHNEAGPAIAWGRDADGNYSASDPDHYALYFWRGSRVPNHWITNPPQTDEERKARAAEVLSKTNTEELRSGAEILGWVPLLESLGMRVIDADQDPKFGKLVAVDLPGAPDSRFLVAQCGTGRTIAVPASPEAKTAVEAGAMSYGVDVATYRQLGLRT